MTEGKNPDWWSEVIDVSIRSKADARRIVRLCRAGERCDTWKPRWSHFKTSEGRIRLADFELACDILMGVKEPIVHPGRGQRHDWEEIAKIADSVIAEMIAENPSARLNRSEVRRRVCDRYRFKLSTEAKRLKELVRQKLKQTGA